jgi:hypothetical protein
VHRSIACFDCHRNGNFSVIAPQCINCHRDDAVKRSQVMPDPTLHAGQGSCSGCHNPNTWLPANIGFNRESVCR